VGTSSPALSAAPAGIQRLSIVIMEQALFGFAKSALLAPFRAVSNRIDAQWHANDAFGPTHLIYPISRQEHVSPRQPVACIDDDVAQCPGLRIQEEVVDVADLSVIRFNVITGHMLGAAQVLIVIPRLICSSSCAVCAPGEGRTIVGDAERPHAIDPPQ
jgi:hypothetical protein